LLKVWSCYHITTLPVPCYHDIIMRKLASYVGLVFITWKLHFLFKSWLAMYFCSIRRRSCIIMIYQELESDQHKNDAALQNSHNLNYFWCGLIIVLQNLNWCLLKMRILDFCVDILIKF
jgi:hypothetical protein